MRLIKFGMVWLSEEAAADEIVGQARSSLVDLPGGAYDQDGPMRYGKSGQITRSFEIWPSDTQTAQQIADELTAEISKGRRVLMAETRDGDLRHTWAKVVSHRFSWGAGEVGVIPVTITFELDYPYWLATVDEPGYLDNGLLFDNGEVFDAGNVEEWDLTGTSHTNTITNTGGAVVPRGQIVFEPESGVTITNPKITNNEDLHYLKYTGSVTYGDQLVIDLLTKSIRKNGDDSYADLEATGLDWMLLYLGENSITVTCDSISGGTVKLFWQWARHYVG